jgi:hypothetical protein
MAMLSINIVCSLLPTYYELKSHLHMGVNFMIFYNISADKVEKMLAFKFSNCSFLHMYAQIFLRKSLNSGAQNGQSRQNVLS